MSPRDSEVGILYEDEFFLVVDKPAGMVVNRAESVKSATLADWADVKIKKSANPEDNDFNLRSGIVHRIDKETSGCLLIAKTAAVFYQLQAQFKHKTVSKNYFTLVHGRLPREGDINAPIGRLPWNREQFGIVPGGKESHTRYKVINFYKNDLGEYSYVEVSPTTGRTHQIRVHFKYLGFPLVGDYLYAGRKQQISDRQWCQRVFLHAAKISFIHPENGKNISVESHLPADLEDVLTKLISSG